MKTKCKAGRPGNRTIVAAALAALGLSACGGSHHREDDINTTPRYLGPISAATYDGSSNDLLTAGLGKTGLAAAAPAYANPASPTALELRRNAIHANYRAVLDINANSGYGSLYGPNVDARGNIIGGEGKIGGTEYIAYSDDGSGRQNVALMVQVPSSFNPDNPCIVTGTSSGSRGIYGAIGSAGEWGLKNGCAVAYTDKGGGTGLYTFEDDAVILQNGLRSGRVNAARNASFAPDLGDIERIGFANGSPNRIAFKHAHSQANPERDWGKYTLQSIEFAYYVLNEQFGAVADDGTRHRERFTPRNTIVIASSISNGAGAALLAAEQDTKGLIDGIAVSEPQTQPARATGYSVRQGGVQASAQGRQILDYSTYAALYQPCIAGSAGRCGALVDKGLLTGAGLLAQQEDARVRLRAYGWLGDSDALHASHALTNVLVAVTYANAYGQFSVTDKVCGFSFAATDAHGNVIPFTDAQKASSFATQSGIIGNVVYENSVGGAKAYQFGVSPSNGQADQSLDGFLCLRALATGVEAVSGGLLDPAMLALSQRVRSGMAQVVASGNLRGKPAIIVSGRADTLVPVNHAARAYTAMNASLEGSASNLRYVEVTNANHFDSFATAFPTLIVPLHVYLFRALDAMYANLKDGKALPPSQLVRTTTRADASTPVTVANVPPILAAPVPADVIKVTGSTVDIPQ